MKTKKNVQLVYFGMFYIQVGCLNNFSALSKDNPAAFFSLFLASNMKWMKFMLVKYEQCAFMRHFIWSKLIISNSFIKRKGMLFPLFVTKFIWCQVLIINFYLFSRYLVWSLLNILTHSLHVYDRTKWICQLNETMLRLSCRLIMKFCALKPTFDLLRWNPGYL